MELGLPTDIGQEELAVKDPYEGVSDDELLAKLEMLTAKYKQSLLLRNKEGLNKFGHLQSS